ncbi:alpha/beta hydrolase [Nocardioides sediminis]|uniref:alpha/beta hydrolase n=1 Tax=Nocardioides sediminis TaxID=433648 RepID=UPI000D30DF9F|nr:alpha/beta hydrolase family protein [Nocardioides sediminis]
MSAHVHHPTRPAGRHGVAGAGEPRLTRVVLASLATGAAAALLLTMVVLPGATEAVTTGSALVGFGLGWTVLRFLCGRAAGRTQGWATVPAVAMTATGAVLLTTAPGDAALSALSWVWPPLMLLLAAWTFLRMRRTLTGTARRLVAGVLALLVAASVAATAENIASRDVARSYPAPGRTYVVGDHRLHLDCRGGDGPTLVLFSGLGEFSASWSRIVDGVSGTTRVCAYDRAGQGWSDDVATPQDGVAAAEDLHTLLSAAGERGPFVLAGHSTGGPYAMTYADRYPDSVAGMVLLDSSSPHQFTAVPSYPVQYALMRRAYGLMPTLARLGLGAALAGSHLPAADAAVVDAWVSSPRAARNSRDELSVVPEVFRQAQALTTLGERPLAVLTASESLHGTEGWGEAQDRMAALSIDSVHRTVDATHAGVVEDPHGAAASVRAIASVVHAVRTGASVATP